MKINRNDFDRFHDYGCLINNRIVYFGSEDEDDTGWESGVDYSSSRKLIKNLVFLDSLNHNLITIYWNSPGGDWGRGMSIYDIIKKLKSPVKFIGLGMVRSMGTIIIQACKYRYLTKNCDFMIHDGEEGMEGESKTFEVWAKYSKYSREKMYDIYYQQIKRKKKKITKKEIEQMYTNDCILTTKENIDIGLADKII